MGTSSEYFCHQTTFQICYLVVGKKLLTEKRDKERCTILWLWEQSLIIGGTL